MNIDENIKYPYVLHHPYTRIKFFLISSCVRCYKLCIHYITEILVKIQFFPAFSDFSCTFPRYDIKGKITNFEKENL